MREREEELKARIATLEAQLSEADNARSHAQDASSKLVEKVRELEIRLKGETVQSVTDWANTTFGEATIEAQYERAKKEWDELKEAIEAGIPTEKIAIEAADVVICLYRIIGTLRREAVNEKMAKNRARKWELDGNGCAQHVKEAH